MIARDLFDFSRPDLARRLLRGGLPALFLAPALPERDFQEWLDAYWAKDILELFRLERRRSFQRFVELVMAQSGGIFEATALARPCEVSRQTITNYAAVLEATFVVHLVRPYVGGAAAEIVSAPKAYGFDTGFVCYHRGWHELRRDDLGLLWEHFVLNELHAHFGRDPIRYWRTKHGTELDFVFSARGRAPVAIECKWSADDVDLSPFSMFRSRYPRGDNYVVASDLDRPFVRTHRGVRVEHVPLETLVARLTTRSRR